MGSIGAKAQLERIDFSKGCWFANLVAERGSGKDNDVGGVGATADDLEFRENPPGFVNDLMNLRFSREGSLTLREGIDYYAPSDLEPLAAATDKINSYISNVNGEAVDQGIVSYTYNLTTREFRFKHTRFGSSWFNFIGNAGGSRTWEAVFYNDRYYFFPRDDILNGASVPFYVNISGVRTTFTGMGSAGIDGLDHATVYKDRVFGINYLAQRIVWSKATDPTIWTAPDGGFFKLSSGDSPEMLIYFEDNLYFTDSGNNLWQFYFSTDPATDGVLKRIATNILVKDFVVADRNLYIATDSNIFVLINNNLIPIADPLYMHMQQISNVSVINLGYGLMVVVTYVNGNLTISRNYVYHFAQRAWTRYEFDWFGDTTKNDQTRIIDGVFVGTVGQDSIYFKLMGTSENFSYDGNAHYPFYRMTISGGARYWDVTRRNNITNATLSYQNIKYYIDTGPKYLGSKDKYKKIKYVMLDAHLGIKENYLNSPDLDPWTVHIHPLPDPVAGTVAVFNLKYVTNQADYPYKVFVNRRMRGLVFSFELVQEYVFFAGTVPNPQVELPGGSPVYSIPYIHNIYIAYMPVDGRAKAHFGSNAYVDQDL